MTGGTWHKIRAALIVDIVEQRRRRTTVQLAALQLAQCTLQRFTAFCRRNVTQHQTVAWSPASRRRFHAWPYARRKSGQGVFCRPNSVKVSTEVQSSSFHREENTKRSPRCMVTIRTTAAHLRWIRWAIRTMVECRRWWGDLCTLHHSRHHHRYRHSLVNSRCHVKWDLEYSSLPTLTIRTPTPGQSHRRMENIHSIDTCS